MILVAVAVLVFTSLGVASERRWGEGAVQASERIVTVLIWGLLPPLTFFVMGRFEITSGVGFGLLIAYVMIATVTLTAFLISTRILALDRPTTGALMNASMQANTGFLGIPLCGALLGAHSVAAAVAYDAAVTSPLFWTVGFGVGAAFGTKAGDTPAQRVRAFVSRNPVLLAAALGLAAPDAITPQSAADFCKHGFSLLLPIGFFLLGVHLMRERKDGVLEFPPRLTAPIATIISLRLVLAPALMLTGSLLIAVPHAYLLQAAMPAGVWSVVAAHIYGLDLRLTASAVAWTTAIVVAAALLAAAVG